MALSSSLGHPTAPEPASRVGCCGGALKGTKDFSFPAHPRAVPTLQAGGQAGDRETVPRSQAPSLPPPTLLCLMTKTRAARSCRAEEALAHTWTSVAGWPRTIHAGRPAPLTVGYSSGCPSSVLCGTYLRRQSSGPGTASLPLQSNGAGLGQPLRLLQCLLGLCGRGKVVTGPGAGAGLAFLRVDPGGGNMVPPWEQNRGPFL